MRSREMWLPRRIRLNRNPSSSCPTGNNERRNSSQASSLANTQLGAYLINCLLPLPMTCRLRSEKSTCARSRFTDSDLRIPEPYRIAMIAASRKPCGRGSAAQTVIRS
ncbi:hypothetical protein D3C73_1377410 [compost metagenome]